MSTHITIIGNVTNDPELKYTKNGDPVLNFSVAYTPRRNVNGEWVDGDANFYDVNVWRKFAEAASTSVQKGQRVVVVGTLKQSRWTTDDGQSRSRHVVDAEEIGISPRFADITYTKCESGAFNGGGASGFQPQAQGNGGFNQAAQNVAQSFGGAQQQQDPWSQGNRQKAPGGAPQRPSYDEQPPW